MKRLCLAIALLFVASTVKADFLYMQYVMGKKKSPDNQQPGGGGHPPGAPGAPGAPGGPGGGGSPNENDVTILTVNAVVELKKAPVALQTRTGGAKWLVTHKYGATSVYNDDKLAAKNLPLAGIKRRFAAKQATLARARTPERVYELAEWALNYGLAGEFAELMDETAKAGKKTGYDALDRAVECYTQVKDALSKRIERDDNAEYWRGKLGFRRTESDHYVLLYSAALSDPPEAKRRLDLLEENMRAVYGWFALKGQVLKMPDQKLVAVLIDDPAEFLLQRQMVDEEPLVSDGFFASRDNVVVFSTQRLDEASQLFAAQMRARYSEGWDRTVLLTGKGKTLAGKSNDERYMMETLALLEAALQEDGERAAVSHEGTRQLFVGAGLQPRTLVLPTWVQFGMASVFETAKPPYPLAPVEVRAPYWHGWGGASWKYTRLFRHFEHEQSMGAREGIIREDKEFTRAGRTLLHTIRDSEFSEARENPRQGSLHLLMGRTYAWGLCHYLTRMRTAGVIRFYEELAKMPRDLELEPDEVVGCFARAFDVADVTGVKIDPAKFESLAKDWLGYMASVATPGTEMQIGVEGGNNSIPGGPPPGGGAPGGGGGGSPVPPGGRP